MSEKVEKWVKLLGKGPGFTTVFLLVLLATSALLVFEHLTAVVFADILKWSITTFFAGGIGKAVGGAWAGSKASGK